MDFLEGLNPHLTVFLVSMLPVVELRGAIPIGAGLGLDPAVNFILCVLGNMVPVPFVMIFFRRLLKWAGKHVSFIGRFAKWWEERSLRRSGVVLKYSFLGLAIFVAIPLPGTGAITGALIADILDMRMKYAIPAIFGGVLVAGLIVSLISYGIVAITI